MIEPVKMSCKTCRWLSSDLECRYDPPVVTPNRLTVWPSPFGGSIRDPWCRNHHDVTGKVTPADVRVASGPTTEGGRR